MSYFLSAALRMIRRPLTPRLFPTTGFDVIDDSYLVEEETWGWYTPEEFYPIRIGQVLKSKYQVVGKLGYGTYATVWLCRDLIDRRHLALKIGTRDALSGELAALKHLKTVGTRHRGALLVRDVIDDFEITTQNKIYQVILHSPLAITLQGLRKIFGDSLHADALKSVLQHLFIALDFLHTEARTVHTGEFRHLGLYLRSVHHFKFLTPDIQERNIMFGFDEKSAGDDLTKFELQEVESPSPRKISGDRVIHTSRPVVPPIYPYGRPVLCDLGQASFGKRNYTHDIQPYQYRAPEVILQIPWDEKVDIWNVGVLIWNLFENDTLFKTKGAENKDDNSIHLAHMIALLGPPPKDFLQRTTTERLWHWFDSDGHWKGITEIPKTNLEDAEKRLDGDDKAQFLRFLRKMLKWKPEERESAKQLLEDPWVKDVKIGKRA